MWVSNKRYNKYFSKKGEVGFSPTKDMAEQLFFIILSIILFGTIFFKMIKKNDTSYVPILAIEAIGIAIDFIVLIANLKMGLVIKVLIYLMSVVLPIIIIILEKYKINIIPNSKILIVNIYMAFGNERKAQEILEKMIDSNYQNYEAHKKLAQIYEKEGGMRKAIQEYTQCIELNIEDYESYYKVASLLKELDRKPEAIDVLQNLISKNPEHVGGAMTLGELLMEQQSYKEAAMVYLDALKYNPVNYELNYNLGMVYTMLNDFNNAKQCYEKAANINHLAYNSKYNLAEIELLFKELDKAEALFQETLSSDELNADCYFELSKINLMKGNKDIAIKYANIAIDLGSKKIVEKIEKEPLFMTIRKRISIPFNLEEKEDCPSLSKRERMVKEHLESTTDLTTNMGYAQRLNDTERQNTIEHEEKEQ